jgi:hypothetical protein
MRSFRLLALLQMGNCWAVGIDQVVKHLPNKLKALSSSPSAKLYI